MCYSSRAHLARIVNTLGNTASLTRISHTLLCPQNRNVFNYLINPSSKYNVLKAPYSFTFVMSHVYWKCLLAGSPDYMTNRLHVIQRILNAAVDLFLVLAQRSVLAWRSRAYQLQAERYYALLHLGESSEVPGWLLVLHTSFEVWPSTTVLSQSTAPYCAI